MASRVRETWLTLRAMWRFCADFFRRWFLPLHSDDEDDDEEEGERFLGWRWDDDESDDKAGDKVTERRDPEPDDPAPKRDDA